MSRTIVVLALLALLVSGAVAGEKSWFDMQNCAMCKNITSQAGLMENIKWEQYPISNGIICVTTVNDGYLDKYHTAHEGMMKMGMRMQNGEKLELCQSCQALGMCMMKGPKQDYVSTSNGDVWILTSNDATVVAELQNWVKRNNEEMAKMHSANSKG